MQPSSDAIARAAALLYRAGLLSAPPLCPHCGALAALRSLADALKIDQNQS